MAYSGEDMVYDRQYFEGESFTLFNLDLGLEDDADHPANDRVPTSVASCYNTNMVEAGVDTSQYTTVATGDQSLPHYAGSGVMSMIPLLGAVSIQTNPEHQTLNGSLSSAGPRSRAVTHSGPVLRFQSFNDTLGTWEETITDIISTDVASSYPMSRPSINTSSVSYTGLNEHHSVYNANNGTCSYPTQLDFESAYAGQQIPSPVLPDPVDPQGWGPSLSGYVMERSFPDHMYRAEKSLVGMNDGPSLGTPSSGYMSDPAAIPPSPSIVTPTTSLTSFFQTTGSTPIIGSPYAEGMVRMMPDQHTVSPPSRTPTRGLDERRTSFTSVEYATQPIVPTRSPSQRSNLSVSDEPPSPTPTFVEEFLECKQIGCDATFTGDYRRGNLARHVRLVHGKVVYPCGAPRCTRDFRRSDARLKHQRKHHPELMHLRPLPRR